MRRKEGGPVRRFFAALAVLIVLLAAGALVFIYSGRYDVTATGEHTGLVRWILETARTQSVRRHAAGVKVPSLEEADIGTGFRNFDRMCVLCHGAPGAERSAIGKGLNPEPPELPKAVRKWTPGELFLIVSHGLKMTGMPAFGPTHDEKTLWAVVAFIRRLPEMTPQQYRELRQRYGQEEDHREPGHFHGEQSGPAPPPSSPRPGGPSGGGKASPPAKKEKNGSIQRAWAAGWEASRIWVRLGAWPLWA